MFGGGRRRDDAQPRRRRRQSWNIAGCSRAHRLQGSRGRRPASEQREQRRQRAVAPNTTANQPAAGSPPGCGGQLLHHRARGRMDGRDGRRPQLVAGCHGGSFTPADLPLTAANPRRLRLRLPLDRLEVHGEQLVPRPTQPHEGPDRKTVAASTTSSSFPRVLCIVLLHRSHTRSPCSPRLHILASLSAPQWPPVSRIFFPLGLAKKCSLDPLELFFPARSLLTSQKCRCSRHWCWTNWSGCCEASQSDCEPRAVAPR